MLTCSTCMEWHHKVPAIVYRNILYQVRTRNSDVITTLGAVTQMEDKVAKKQLVAATFLSEQACKCTHTQTHTHGTSTTAK